MLRFSALHLATWTGRARNWTANPAVSRPNRSSKSHLNSHGFFYLVDVLVFLLRLHEASQILTYQDTTADTSSLLDIIWQIPLSWILVVTAHRRLTSSLYLVIFLGIWQSVSLHCGFRWVAAAPVSFWVLECTPSSVYWTLLLSWKEATQLSSI